MVSSLQQRLTERQYALSLVVIGNTIHLCWLLICCVAIISQYDGSEQYWLLHSEEAHN